MMTLCKQCLFPGLSEVPLNSLACNWIVLLKQITYLLTIVIQRRLYRRHSFKMPIKYMLWVVLQTYIYEDHMLFSQYHSDVTSSGGLSVNNGNNS